MNKIFRLFHFFAVAVILCGCQVVEKMPSEDIEVPKKYAKIISVLKNKELSPDSREKYEAAKELIRYVDLTYTRETATIDKIFYHRDAMADSLQSDTPTFTFNYRYRDNMVRIRFFTYKMFVTRVEVTEK